MANYHDEESKEDIIQQAIKSRNRTKSFKNILGVLGDLDIEKKKNKVLKRKLQKAGYTGEVNEKTVIAYNAMERAKNNSRDFEILRDTIGEKPSDKINIDVDARVDAVDILNKHFN